MSVKDHRELRAWRLANELRQAIIQLTASGPGARDRKFCEQIRESSSSVCTNITEGFYRFRHREFASFLSIARGSLGETADHLENGKLRGYFGEEDLTACWGLYDRTMRALSRLHRYLRETPDWGSRVARDMDRGRPAREAPSTGHPHPARHPAPSTEHPHSARVRVTARDLFLPTATAIVSLSTGWRL